MKQAKANKANLTPMMKQYYELKKEQQDKFLFFRLGDFYELFGDDAKEASKILSILLTHRNGIPMCGIPHHQFHNYAHKIIKQGRKIAIAEQINKEGEGDEKIISRKITKIISPGMVLDENILSAEENNFILFVYFKQKDGLSECYLLNIDISTAEVFLTILTSEFLNKMKSYFFTYKPKEIVVLQNNLPSDILKSLENSFPQIVIDHLADLDLKEVKIDDLMEAIFDDDFFLDENHQEIYQLLAKFVILNKYENILFLKKPINIDLEDFLILDHLALKHLEVIEGQYEDSRDFSLIKSVDHTLTPMGARILKQNLVKPLKNKIQIHERLNVVEQFKKNQLGLLSLRNSLKKIFDLERMNIKIHNATINPREILHLANNVKSIQQACQTIESEFNGLFAFPWIKEMFCDEFDASKKKIIHLAQKILPNPRLNLKEGEVINPEHDKELTHYASIKKESLSALNSLEQEVKEKLGINSLKVKYNGNMGFFFEINKNHSHKISRDFIKKQSLINSERFVNEELIKLESRISNANELLVSREMLLFQQILTELKQEKKFLEKISLFIAKIDFLSSLAFLANKRNYVRPMFNDERNLTIENARHPVVESQISLEEDFIPNSLLMSDENYFHLITGPNMAGKSTFLRQNALIIILAQMGSFIPADAANLPIFDRIFTRVGSGDKLAQGESTFMVEMKEVANILKHSSDDSFVIMDEVGRGTSTYDGLAIAWGIIAYFINSTPRRPKVLFATHYHELGKIADENKIVENYNIAVKELERKIVFLKKVEKGLANKSYGIYVAELAGIPEEVLQIAKKILQQITGRNERIGVELNNTSMATTTVPDEKVAKEVPDDGNGIGKILLDEVKKADLNDLTPLDALNFLNKLKEIVKASE